MSPNHAQSTGWEAIHNDRPVRVAARPALVHGCRAPAHAHHWAGSNSDSTPEEPTFGPGPGRGLPPGRTRSHLARAPRDYLEVKGHFGTRFIPPQVKAPPGSTYLRFPPGAASCVTCGPDYDGLADVSPVTLLLPTRAHCQGRTARLRVPSNSAP